MTKLVIISGEKRRNRRPDMSVRAGDSCEAAQDPTVVEAVTGVDIVLDALGQRAADHMSYVDRRAAMEDLDAHGLVSRDTQPHTQSKIRNFAAGVLQTLRS